MWRTALAVLLVGPGILTILVWSPSPGAEAPMDTSRSWLLGEARMASLVLAVVAGTLVAASGLALLGHQDWWSLVGLAGGALSLALFGLLSPHCGTASPADCRSVSREDGSPLLSWRTQAQDDHQSV
jgi:hypothetical protein